MLVSSEHTAERVIVDDACVHCTYRIRVVLEGGAVAAVEPSEALVFAGGG